jgi:hypothetical protein
MQKIVDGKSNIFPEIEYVLQPCKERDHWEDQDVGGWTILKWILER